MKTTRIFSSLRAISRINFVVFRHCSTDSIIVEEVNSIMLIGINRPHQRNSLNEHTLNLLRESLKKFQLNSECNVGILYGVGANFCSGLDLKEISESCRKDYSIFPLPSEKPVIAAIEGCAVGTGLELALACDLRIVSENASFGFLSRRFGVPLTNGGPSRLPKLIGLSRSMDLILTGRTIDAKTGQEWGLVNRVVPIGAALGQAVSLASSINMFPVGCLRADKAAAEYSTFEAQSLSHALKFEDENSKDIWPSEAMNGAKRFVEGIGKHGSFKIHKL